MAYTTLVSGTTITASWANASVRDQSVSPFADTTARAAAITAPVAGMISVLTTTLRADVYNGSSWSSLVNPSSGGWISWTPTVTQSVSVTVTNNGARYIRTGRKVTATFQLTVTGAGTAANNVIIGGLPFTAITSGLLLGSGEIFDASVPTTWSGFVISASTTTLAIRNPSGANNPLYGTSGFVAALAVSDTLNGTFTYEVNADG